MLRHLALALAFLSFGAGTAEAQFDLVAGYDDRAARGPAGARGAVIWNHGKAANGLDSFGETPFFLDILRDAGWDVFRLHRQASADNEEGATRALIREAEGLRARGYPRIVTAGQSFGGWISYLAATRTAGLFDAIVANAPAAHGKAGESHNWNLNADRLYAIAADLKPTRVMTFFFAKDPYDPGGRGRKLGEILGARSIPNVMIDQRPGLEGHGAGRTLAFARVYDRCIRDFVELPEVPDGFTCRATQPRPVAQDFVLPAGTAPARHVPDAAKSFAGRWFGWYAQGREMLLIVREVRGADVTAIYAWTALARDPKDVAGYRVRRGRIDAEAGKLVFDEAGQSRIEFTRRRDGQMDVLWVRAGGGTPITGTVRRLD